MIDRRSRHRIHGMLADVVMLELWLAHELPDDEVTLSELEDAFCRIQARQMVVQAILWPSDDASDPAGDLADADSNDENPHG